jgi:hypothetical protein
MKRGTLAIIYVLSYVHPTAAEGSRRVINDRSPDGGGGLSYPPDDVTFGLVWHVALEGVLLGEVQITVSWLRGQHEGSLWI